jgi:molybdopterin-guanine dinucleotide biosynthesis protein A
VTKATIILAGGMSARLRGGKPFLLLKGKPLLSHVLARATRFSDEIVLAIGHTDPIENYQRFLPELVRIARDNSSLQSPLVGILTGLRQVRSSYAVVLPCDHPFLSEQVISYLYEKVAGFDAAIPRWSNANIEPLHSVYKVTETISAAENALAMNEMKVSRMIERLGNVHYVDVEKLRAFDKDLLTFFNINTEDDMRRAEEILMSTSGSPHLRHVH